jgi:uncharacterized protein (DUF58 family)
MRQRWLRRIRVPHPCAGTIRLHPRRVYIFPTYAGLFYTLTIFAMFLVSINYNLALGHALVFLLFSLGLVGMLHTCRNLLGLEIDALENMPLHAGETAHFCLRVRNTRARPRPGLEWSGGSHPEPQVMHLAPEADTILRIAVVTKHRGWLALPILKVSSRYPLGILLTWAYVWPDARCLVYPHPRFTPLPDAVESDGGEGVASGRDGHDDFAGLRERQPADSLRHVAWRIAARETNNARPLLVKCFSGGATRQLWLDWRMTEGYAELRVSTLTGWVLMAEEEGLEYGLRLPGLEIPLDRGTSHRHVCLQALALFREMA